MKKERIPKDPMLYQATVWPKGFIIPGNKDPLGSYTGVAMDPYETPVQDADDL
ncbi:MAG: hypothetical protein IJ388_03570 [Oscillospiraceae bacterium]|nr:hypothetical protein [Oscillospiraceae bacterium]